mmetsp:Transcript_22167/g.21391  ORF Transcript_22167/g.21391 Transcript_22167/m.21391 type:complete len:84 (+) Transcript_22167:413-664(+)
MSHGHLLADIDPLQLAKVYRNEKDSLRHKYKWAPTELKREVDYKTYGFTEEDLDRTFYIDNSELGGILGKKKNWKLKDLIKAY